MSKNTFTLTIETPEGTIVTDLPIYSISFKAEDGMVQVMPHHMSYMSTITYTRVKLIFPDDSEEIYLCRNGIFSFDNTTNSGRLIAEYCQLKSEVNMDSVKDYLAYIQQQLSSGSDLSNVQLVYLENEKIAVEQMME